MSDYARIIVEIIIIKFYSHFHKICYNIPMENVERYKHLNKYYKEKFGERTLKICIDGGFTCPNRDGSKGIGGCIFCSEKGSGEHITCPAQNSMEDKISLSSNYLLKNESLTNFEFISQQVKNYFSSYKAQRANKFIAYKFVGSLCCLIS